MAVYTEHQIHSHDIFQIEFCGSCSHPTQVDENQWLLPPLTFSTMVMIALFL